MWSHWGRCLLVHLQGDFICKSRGWQCWEVLLRFTATVSTKLRLILCCKWHLSMHCAVLQLQKCSPLQLKSLILMTNQTSKHHQRSPNIHIYPLLRILTLWVDSRRSWSQTHVIQTYPNSKAASRTAETLAIGMSCPLQDPARRYSAQECPAKPSHGG